MDPGVTQMREPCLRGIPAFLYRETSSGVLWPTPCVPLSAPYSSHEGKPLFRIPKKIPGTQSPREHRADRKRFFCFRHIQSNTSFSPSERWEVSQGVSI